jgi:anti-anti-sigma factor
MPEKLPIDITTDTHGRWTILSVVGDLDMATAPELERSAAVAGTELAIELSGVRFIDSSGLRALFQVNQAIDHVALVAPSAVVKRLLSLTDMAQIFVVVDERSALSDLA